jgi:prepilin-type N-terminal cleavage/methylation domain-containing protein
MRDFVIRTGPCRWLWTMIRRIVTITNGVQFEFMKRAFTLVEVLVVIAVIAILAALFFPTLSAAKARAQRTICINNLRQINSAMRLYWDDHSDFPPGVKNSADAPFGYWTGYKKLIESYAGVKSVSSPSDKLFACPADTFYYDFLSRTNYPFYTTLGFHNQSITDFSSYWVTQSESNCHTPAFVGGSFLFQSNAPVSPLNETHAEKTLKTRSANSTPYLPPSNARIFTNDPSGSPSGNE